MDKRWGFTGIKCMGQYTIAVIVEDARGDERGILVNVVRLL